MKTVPFRPCVLESVQWKLEIWSLHLVIRGYSGRVGEWTLLKVEQKLAVLNKGFAK